MSLPGFKPGEKAQNTVVAAMYLVAIAAVVGGVVMVAGMPSSGGGSADTASNQSAGAAKETQAPTGPQTEAEGSGWETVSSSGGSSGTASSDATPRLSENKIQLNILRNSMENSSRLELLSADIRQNEMYVRYTQDSMSQSDVRSGAGSVGGIYFGLVGTGADLQAIHAQLVDDSGQVAYTYTIKRQTIVKYNNGEITKQQLKQEIISSIQSTDQTTTSIGV